MTIPASRLIHERFYWIKVRGATTLSVGQYQEQNGNRRFWDIIGSDEMIPLSDVEPVREIMTPSWEEL